MFASFCRRRLLRRMLEISGSGTTPLQPIPAAFPFPRSYSPAAIACVSNSEPCPATVSYLISCGLLPAAAAATGKNCRIHSTVKADGVRALLSQYGFTDAEIVRVVRSAPTVLVADPERILRPKLDFFASIGLQPCKIATAPVLLTRSLDKHVAPSIQFIRDIIGSDNDLRLSISRAPRALIVDLEKHMRPAVEALRSCGLTEAAISRLLIIHLGVLMASPDRIREIVEKLKEIGMSISDSRFLYCFCVMCTISSGAWWRKLAFFQNIGLSEAEVLKAFKKQASIMRLAEENIKKKVRFLLDELKLGISDVIVQPVILGYSLEKCILPRCAVLSVLMREGKIQRDIRLLQALLGNSKDFSAKYVLRHADDVPDVVKAYEGKIKFEGFIQ